MTHRVLLAAAAIIQGALAECEPADFDLAGAAFEPGLCARVFTLGNNIRAMDVTPTGDVIGLDRDSLSVLSFKDDDLDGIAESSHRIAYDGNLNHGVAIHGEYIYASSDTTVFRYAFVPGGVADQTTTKQVVVSNMNADGNGGAPRGHETRSLGFDAEGKLYISIGSMQNVDDDAYRSRIRKFDLSGSIPAGGIDFSEGEVYADGIRNTVGFTFDKHGVMWGVNNGADSLIRTDLGGDIHNDNPADEVARGSFRLVGQTAAAQCLQRP